jgi:NADPH-dependent curcumin reductase CurA
VYFDNVGGEILDTVLTRMNPVRRSRVCGTISDYSSPSRTGVRSWRAILVNRLRVPGMIVFDWKDRYGEALKELGGFLAQGKLRVQGIGGRRDWKTRRAADRSAGRVKTSENNW